MAWFNRELVHRPIDYGHIGDLRSWLTHFALGGDVDAAEWILLTAVSSAAFRESEAPSSSLTIACFPVPPSPFPRSASPTIFSALQRILPLFTIVELSSQTFRECSFNPKTRKDGDLQAGLFQHPKRSMILLSELTRPLETGLAGAVARHNIEIAQTVIDRQTLQYEFPFNRIGFPTDLRILNLTPSSTSQLFKTHFTLPIQPSGAEHLYQPILEDQWPSVSQISSFQDIIKGDNSNRVSISKTCSQYIENDFVEARKQDGSISAKDLTSWISLAKAKATLDGYTCVEVETWKQIRSLDIRRRKRILQVHRTTMNTYTCANSF